MKKVLFLLVMSCAKYAFAQINETYNDGNFTSNPVWSGSNSSADFIVTTQQLRSNSTTANNNFYLSTTSTLANNCTWEFWVNLQFNPSGANYVDVYLISDQANLQSASINGYFIRIGNTNDEVALYKRAGSSSSITKLIDGADGILNTSNNKVKIRVTRTASNQFTLERDITGLGTSFISEGSFLDATFTTSSHFGIFIQQSTATFHQKHFFDDILISATNNDNTAPELLSSAVIDSTTIELTFTEAVDSLTARQSNNYSISNGFGNPVLVTTTTDEAKYRLKLDRGLITASYQITVGGIKDKAGNAISANSTISFSYIKPYVAVKGDLVINEFFADPSPQVDLPSVEFVEIFNNTNHSISLAGWKFADPTSAASLPADSISSGKYLILCAKADTTEFKVYGKTIGLSPWPSLNNASDVIKLISPENKTTDSIAYFDTWHDSVKKSGGWSLERIDHKSQCQGIHNWASSTDSSGGTPGKLNSIYTANYNQLSLKVDSARKLNDKDISIYFNKPVEASSLTGGFSLNPGSGNSSFISDASGKKVTLTFQTAFLPNTSYTLNVQTIKDCAGNDVSPFTFQFLTPKLPPQRADTAKLFITEIFADPSPEVNLPLVEFVEIYNPGADTIDLDGWTLADGSTKANLSKQSIYPNEYLVICPIADSASYNKDNRAIGISPWPSLNNTSDQITLKSFTGRLVDSVAYFDSWHTSDKKAGGWTLERVDHSSKCNGAYAWSSSINPKGGSPGRANSVYKQNYDALPFKADSLVRLSDSTLLVHLNKAADVTSASNAFKVTPTKTLKNFSFTSDLTQAKLTFQQGFSSSTSYQLNISGLRDCAGNLVGYDPAAFTFTTPKAPLAQPDTALILITEVLADPSPEVRLPLGEFVELFNPGTDTVNLGDWSLFNSKTKASIPKVIIEPKGYLILCAVADTSQYRSYGKPVGLTQWPTLTNTSDKITLRSSKGRSVDSLSYQDSWHSGNKKQGGWSLERVDTRSVCKPEFNWTSSIDHAGGTPGRQNSVNYSGYDQLLFTADTIMQASDSSLIVMFNKHIDQSSVTNAFSLQPSSGTVKSVVLNAKALSAAITFTDKLKPATSYTLNIQELKDCSGRSISQPVTLLFRTSAPPPIRQDTAKLFITEIFADPSPEVGLPLAEFVEIFNAGKDTIDLSNYSLSNSKTKSTVKHGSILPNEYLVLTASGDSITYSSIAKTLGQFAWPTLTNTADKVVLKSFSGRTIDSVSYSDTWHSTSLKKQGGWSLERVDIYSVCRGMSNWLSSVDLSGGTPGSQNSVYRSDYDKFAFKADSIRKLSDSTIQVYFNKALGLPAKATSFVLTPSTGSIESLTFDEHAITAKLRFKNHLSPGTTYKLNISSLTDCAGNGIVSNDLSFITPNLSQPRVDTANLYITEIFADPSPEVGLPLAEFVEIFNAGKDTIDLNGWSINDATTKASIKLGSIAPSQYLILCAAADTVFYQKHGKVIGISPWPSLNNSSDKLQLRSFKNRLSDSVAYSDTWYRDDKKKTGGWSLERIAIKSPCTESQNWLASKNADGGTPGKENSVNNLYKLADELKVLHADLIDSNTIDLTFNRPPDSIALVDASNYLVNNGLGKPASITAEPSLTIARLKFNNHVAGGVNYTITATNIHDCEGRRIAQANSVAELFIPHPIEKGDILVNEILFNPRPGGADFVEIYNKSDNVLDVKDLSISSSKGDSLINVKKLTTESFLLKPKDYLVLTIDPDNIRKEYRSEDKFLKVPSLPGFNNDEGSVVLISRGQKIDEMRYNEKMHNKLIKDPKGISLERSSFNRPTNEPGNFRSAANSVGFATPGYKNSQSVEDITPGLEEVALLSKTFSPDNDGFEDALQISYNFNEPGLVANASIYNNNGVLIKRLARNVTLSTQGTFVWDGLKESGELAPIGIYIVYFDVFSLNGKTRKFKKACVLAAKL